MKFFYLRRDESIEEGRLLTEIALLMSWGANHKSLLHGFAHFIGGKIGRSTDSLLTIFFVFFTRNFLYSN